MTAVSDSGPLIALAKIGGLDVFAQLFPSVLISPAVYRESVDEGLRRGDPDAELLQAHAGSGFLVVAPPQIGEFRTCRHLGAGEHESIRLAVEHRPRLLLIDDRDAREAATMELQLRAISTEIRGTLGVIIEASGKRRFLFNERSTWWRPSTSGRTSGSAPSFVRRS